MNRPGFYSLFSGSIGAAGSLEHSEITALDGMSGVTLEVAFSGGTGGTSLTVVVQTRLGSGGIWRDIARFEFTGAATKYANLVAGAASVAAFPALAAEGQTQNFLGTELRCTRSSVGTYTNSSLSVLAAVR